MLQAKPDGFRARFAVTFAPKKATESGNHAHGFAQ